MCVFSVSRPQRAQENHTKGIEGRLQASVQATARPAQVWVKVTDSDFILVSRVGWWGFQETWSGVEAKPNKQIPSMQGTDTAKMTQLHAPAKMRALMLFAMCLATYSWRSSCWTPQVSWFNLLSQHKAKVGCECSSDGATEEAFSYRLARWISHMKWWQVDHWHSVILGLWQ